MCKNSKVCLNINKSQNKNNHFVFFSIQRMTQPSQLARNMQKKTTQLMIHNFERIQKSKNFERKMCNLSKPNFIGDSSEPNYRRKIIDSVILLPFFVTIRVCFCGLVHVDNGALISYRILSNTFEHLKMLVFFVFVSKYDYSGINGLEENLRTNYACWDLSQSTISKKTTLTITLRFFFLVWKKNWFVSLRFSYIHSIKA